MVAKQRIDSLDEKSAIELSKKYSILSKFTSFIAVDKNNNPCENSMQIWTNKQKQRLPINLSKAFGIDDSRRKREETASTIRKSVFSLFLCVYFKVKEKNHWESFEMFLELNI